ncbi:MAG TPA: Rrf2 family transcriptional regulator [Nitrospiraceae bacterium]|jgi:Rrf2 family protein|nr:Rrf2 family transcriptional regulator [Nitrospiraceae bacterium]
MTITRETDYAVRCVLYLAKNVGSIMVVDSIAGDAGIPKSFLAKILQKLAKAGIVKSTRGVKGGFQLAKEPDELSLMCVIEAIQGHPALNICVLDSKKCSRSCFCSIHPVWMDIQGEIEKKLDRYSISGLAKEEISREQQRREQS